MKRKNNSLVFYIVGSLLAAIWLFPIIGIVMASVRPYSEIIRGWWDTEVFNLTLQNFIYAWAHPNFPLNKGLLNSMFISIPSTLLPLFISSPI